MAIDTSSSVYEDLAIAQTIGGGIGSALGFYQRKKQFDEQKQRKEQANLAITGVLSEGNRKGWTRRQMLEAAKNIPNYLETKRGQKIANWELEDAFGRGPIGKTLGKTLRGAENYWQQNPSTGEWSKTPVPTGRAGQRTPEQIARDAATIQSAKKKAEETGDRALGELYDKRLGELDKELADVFGQKFVDVPEKTEKRSLFGIDQLWPDKVTPATQKLVPKNVSTVEAAKAEDSQLNKGEVKVQGPDGKIYALPAGELEEAKKQGYKLITVPAKDKARFAGSKESFMQPGGAIGPVKHYSEEGGAIGPIPRWNEEGGAIGPKESEEIAKPPHPRLALIWGSLDVERRVQAKALLKRGVDIDTVIKAITGRN